MHVITLTISPTRRLFHGLTIRLPVVGSKTWTFFEFSSVSERCLLISSNKSFNALIMTMTKRGAKISGFPFDTEISLIACMIPIIYEGKLILIAQQFMAIYQEIDVCNFGKLLHKILWDERNDVILSCANSIVRQLRIKASRNDFSVDILSFSLRSLWWQVSIFEVYSRS